ncbi:MAG: hypothetical protein IPN68_10365 [Bacteroidetes bacterium]|nr:hypothetical protein [Bacteroidota bacterium]
MGIACIMGALSFVSIFLSIKSDKRPIIIIMIRSTSNLAAGPLGGKNPQERRILYINPKFSENEVNEGSLLPKGVPEIL